MRALWCCVVCALSPLGGATCRTGEPAPSVAETQVSATEEPPMPGPELGLQGPASLPAQAERAYFSLAQMRFIVGDTPPAGLHVAGRVEQGSFVPSGKVEGEHLTVMGPGQPGWLELADGSFHGAMEGRPPFPPYLQGTLYDDVGFVPSDPTIRR